MPGSSTAVEDNHNDSDWWKWKISRSEFASKPVGEDDSTKFIKAKLIGICKL